MVAFGLSWLFLQRNNSHRLHLGSSPGTADRCLLERHKREHYGNFSVVEMLISRCEAANSNLACSPGVSATGRERARAKICRAIRYALVTGSGIL
jgi:hypothetical protein